MTVDSSSSSNSAVEQLHATLVVLRRELVSKNKTIQSLEESLELSSSKKSIKEQFDAMFEPVMVTTEEEEDNNEDLDEIITEEDLRRRQEKEAADLRRRHEESELAKQRNFKSGPPTNDPIMEFVLSEEEDIEEIKADNNNNNNDDEESECKFLELVPNEHIVFHTPPKPCLTPDRPVLRASPGGSSCSGSQTDITALRDVCEVGGRSLASSSEVGRSSSETGGGGRYSILNRDFTLKEDVVASVPQQMVKMVRISNKVERHDYSLPPSLSPTSMNDVNLLEPSYDDICASSDSLDSLLAETTQYLKAASRGGLLLCDDWDRIDQAKEQEKRVKAMGKRTKRGFAYPFVPLSSSDLRVGNVVRILLLSSKALVSGIVRYVHVRSEEDADTTEEFVGVETKEEVAMREASARRDWKKYFHCSSGHGMLLPLWQIVMCVQ